MSSNNVLSKTHTELETLLKENTYTLQNNIRLNERK